MTLSNDWGRDVVTPVLRPCKTHDLSFFEITVYSLTLLRQYSLNEWWRLVLGTRWVSYEGNGSVTTLVVVLRLFDITGLYCYDVILNRRTKVTFITLGSPHLCSVNVIGVRYSTYVNLLLGDPFYPGLTKPGLPKHPYHLTSTLGIYTSSTRHLIPYRHAHKRLYKTYTSSL